MKQLALLLLTMALAAPASTILADETSGPESADRKPKLNGAAREYLLQGHFKSAPQTLDGALE